MSASSKKKLRNQQDAGKLTERQIAEQKEAKKLKLYSTIFVVVLAVLLVVAVAIGVTKTIENSGTREKNTVAMSVAGQELSNAELSYYYIDTINNFYANSGSYASLIGLDVTKPLNEQVMNESTGETWADYFLTSAKDTAAAQYTLCAEAEAAGHALSDAEQISVDNTVASAALYANVYGYGDTDTYLKAMYGKGASEESYRAYVERSLLADSYYTAYGETLTYDDAALRAAEAENYDQYSAFTYHYYYLPASRFLKGGTTDAEGKTTYTEEETAASIAACEEAAKILTGEDITSVDALDDAIAALEINADSTDVTSTFYEDNTYDYIAPAIAQWLSDDARTEGDKAYIANTNGDEIIGYYVIYYHSTNDNSFPLKNVRHILVGFQGGATDENGVTTYSDEEKATAKADAEEVLNTFKAGAATEESFAALVAEKSTDTASIENGGLYEDVYPGQMVSAFEDWCFAEGRKNGDTGIVETEYGYHVMYFVGDSDLTYRDFQITNDLVTEDLNAWYEALIANTDVVDGDTKYINTALILNANA